MRAWEDGRLLTGYRKIQLLHCFGFDIYLVHYPESSHLPWHYDTVSEKEHHRLNIVLVKAEVGGHLTFTEDSLEKSITARIYLFRPDLVMHRLSKVLKGYRLVLSIGWVR